MGHLEEGDLQSFLDGALSLERSAKIREHLAGCRDCSGILSQVEKHTFSSGESLSVLTAVGSEQPPELQTARARFHDFNHHKEHKTMWYQIFLGRSRAFQVTALLVTILLVSLAFPPVRAIANSFLGLFLSAEAESAAHASCATGLANNTASGFTIAESMSSFQVGTTSVIIATSKPLVSRHGMSVNRLSIAHTGKM